MMGRFATASDGPPRPYSDVKEERFRADPDVRVRHLLRDEISGLEAAAVCCLDRGEAARLQCEAEALRAALTDAHVPTKRR